MATIATGRTDFEREVRFFAVSAVVMALVLVLGFSIQLVAGRSSFAAPWPVHAHALLFFGWTTLYVTQSFLAGTAASVALHRRLGWLAVGWIPAMIVAGTYVTIAMVRRGHAPFFFTPLDFLILDPMTVIVFAGLATAGIVSRRNTQWHRRLMFCSMAMLLGPGFGRILPMPLLIPWADWAAFLPILIFPIAGMIRDRRLYGKVHAAWRWGFGVMFASQIATVAIVASPLGLAIYDAVTAGSPGAAIAPRAFPPFPHG